MKKAVLYLLLLLVGYHAYIPETCSAFTTRRVVLIGPIDTARYQSEELNKLVSERWKRVFRYPFYEVVAQIQNPGKLPDKLLLARLAQEQSADLIVSAEFARLRSYTYSRGLWDDETWQETELRLVATTYLRSNDQYQVFSVSRSQNEPISVDTGPLRLMDDAMDEVLSRIPFKRIPEA